MRRNQVIIVLGLMIWSLRCASLEASIAWMNDVRQAQQIAQQQQRLVLLHFYADWCGPCVRLEREVYPRADISSAIMSNYIPVKINIQRSPELVRQYGVQSFPTDIVLDPGGRVLFRATTPSDANRYLRMLNDLATNQNPAPQRTQPSDHLANQPATRHPEPGQHAYPTQTAAAQIWQPNHTYAGHGTYTSPANSGTMYANPHVPEQRPGPSAWQAPAAMVSEPSAAARPVLALDGFCPVSLTQNETWQRGDQRWGLVHRGRIYLFASAEHQQQFWTDPDRYSPVLSGYDPTRFVDYGQPVDGRREHGMWFRGKMYLFAEEATLQRFQTSPEYYAQKCHEIMMRGGRR